MTDYTDLKARLLTHAVDTVHYSTATPALLGEALAAIEELEQRSASADEAIYRAAGLTHRETLPPIEEVVTGIESAVYRLLERTLRAEQRISMGGSFVTCSDRNAGDGPGQPVAGESPAPSAPAQEPFAWHWRDGYGSDHFVVGPGPKHEHPGTSLYAAPPQSLTDAQIVEIRDDHLPSQGEPFDCIAFARAVLRAYLKDRT